MGSQSSSLILSRRAYASSVKPAVSFANASVTMRCAPAVDFFATLSRSTRTCQPGRSALPRRPLRSLRSLRSRRPCSTTRSSGPGRYIGHLLLQGVDLSLQTCQRDRHLNRVQLLCLDRERLHEVAETNCREAPRDKYNPNEISPDYSHRTVLQKINEKVHTRSEAGY